MIDGPQALYEFQKAAMSVGLLSEAVLFSHELLPAPHRPPSRLRAESTAVYVFSLSLEPLGWSPLWHMTGPGWHGVDLVFLAPGDLVVAIEVKGTLVPGRVPRLSAGELVQMSAARVDKVDNPGMAELGLASPDVYGGVAVVNLADLTWRIALTRDCQIFELTAAQEQLASLAWLVGGEAAGT
jgi:hypothetical protein